MREGRGEFFFYTVLSCWNIPAMQPLSLTSSLSPVPIKWLTIEIMNKKSSLIKVDDFNALLEESPLPFMSKRRMPKRFAVTEVNASRDQKTRSDVSDTGLMKRSVFVHLQLSVDCLTESLSLFFNQRLSNLTRNVSLNREEGIRKEDSLTCLSSDSAHARYCG